MKKLFLLGTLLLAFAFATFAQTDNQPAPTTSTELKKGKGKGKGKVKAEAKGNNMKQELGLNDEQVAKMKDFGATLKGKMKAIKSDEALSKKDKRAQMKDAATTFDGQVKGLLTPEQYTKWGVMKQNKKSEMKGKVKGKKGVKQEDDDMDLPDDGQ
jgi:periplasmic protein CpxP/Spy